MKRAIFSSLALVSLAWSGAALAWFDVEAVYGTRWTSSETGSADPVKDDANDFTVAAHMSPVPLLPVSAGLSASMITFDKDETNDPDVTGTELGLDIKAWLPMVPVVTPYARVRYLVWSTYAATGTMSLPTGDIDYAMAYTNSGYQYGVGVRYPVVPLVGLKIETNMGASTLTPESMTMDDEDISVSDSDPTEVSFSSVLVGIDISI